MNGPQFRRAPSGLYVPELPPHPAVAKCASSRPIGFTEAWGRYCDESPSSRRSKLWSVWRKQIAPELGELPVAGLLARVLARWERRMIAEGYAPKTTADAFACIVAAARSALGDDDLPWRTGPGKYWHPSRRPDPRRETRALETVEEAEAVIGVALLEDRARRARDIFADMGPRVAVCLLLALRNGELAGLGWDDLALEQESAQARIRHQALDQWRTHYPSWTRPIAPPKGKKEWTIDLHPTAVLALLAQRELVEQRGWYRPDGPVFPGQRAPFEGTWRNNANGIRPTDFKRIARKAGLAFPDEWVPHGLRHSAATLEHNAGATLREIQKKTRHSCLRVLEGYIHARTRSRSKVRLLSVAFDADDADTERDPDCVALLEKEAANG